MFVSSRSFYLLLNEMCLFSITSAVLKRDFQDVDPKNLLASQYEFVWLQLSEYVDITCRSQNA